MIQELLQQIEVDSDGFYIYPHTLVVDAGHGDIDDRNNPVTAGKKYYHKGKKFTNHPIKGWFIEGRNNRIIAEVFISKLTKLQIPYVRTYHPVLDMGLTSVRVPAVNRVNKLTKGNCFGLSLHHNYTSTHSTRGFTVWTSKGETNSDLLADTMYHLYKKYFPNYRTRTPHRGKIDRPKDFESNFTILYKTFPAFILNEWGFMGNLKDMEFVTSKKAIDKYTDMLVEWVLWVQINLTKIKKGTYIHENTKKSKTDK